MTLAPNTTYYYRVKAINSNQESVYSNVIAVTTLDDNDANITPLPVNNPVINSIYTDVTTTTIYIELPDPNTYTKEYKLTISTNSDLSSPIYNQLTYLVDKNTCIVTDNDINYIALSIGNLTSNTLYYGGLKASNKIGSSSNTTFNFTTLKPTKAPIAIGVTDLTAITARANWNSVYLADSYRLDVASDSSFASLVIDNLNVGNVLYYDIPVLVENTDYYYRVRCVIGSNTSNHSNVIKFTTLDGVETYDGLSYNINAPTIKQLKNINDTEAIIFWNKVDKAESYTLDLSTSPTFSSFILNNITLKNTEYKLTGLTANTIYYFRVRANSTAYNSNFSSTVFTTLTVNSGLNAPQLLTPTSNLISSQTVALNWVTRTYATRYYIQVSTVSNFASILKSVYVNDTDNYLIDGLTPNTSYYFRLYGLNNIERSIASNVINITTDTVLPTITLSDPTELTNSTVKLSWSTNVVYITYIINIYKSFDTSSYLGNDFYYNRMIGNTSNIYIDLFLEDDTTYSYFITGITSEGDFKSSNVGEFTTKAYPPILKLSQDGTYIEWDKNLNRLEVATDSNFKFLLKGYTPRSVSNTPKKFNISKLLKENINYYIRGYYYTATKGIYSNVISLYGKFPTLLAPKVTKTTALLSWKKNASTNYRIQVKKDISGTFTPITGHTFPVEVGNVNTFLLENLDADSLYSVTIQYYDGTKFSLNSLPLYFQTNKFDGSSDLTENGSLDTITTTFSNISYDRFTINLDGGVYDKYLLELSPRSDFLTYEYIELDGTNDIPYEYALAEPNTTYYIQLYGVDGTDKTTVHSNNVSTASVTAYNSPLSGTPSITSSTILSGSEAIVAWSEITNSYGYVIEVSQSNTFNLLDTSIYVDFIDVRKALLSNLSTLHTYYVRVYAYNDGSISNYSSAITIDTDI